MATTLRGVPTPDTEATPELPMGRRIELLGRGESFVREVEGPEGAPTIILLHGWIASAGLNWFRVFEPLSEHFHVVAPDMRGHGRGIRNRRRFTLNDCADDVAALCDQLGIESAILCGYSMGGPVSLLTWKRHPHLVDGLVLAATSYNVVPGIRDQLIFVGLMAAMAGSTRMGQTLTHLPIRAMRRFQAQPEGRMRPDSFQRWAAAEAARHDIRLLIEAGQALGTFNAKKWVKDIDVPSTVLITTKDRGIRPSAQFHLAVEIPDAEIEMFDEGHVAPMLTTFAQPVVDACLGVAARVYPERPVAHTFDVG